MRAKRNLKNSFLLLVVLLNYECIKFPAFATTAEDLPIVPLNPQTVEDCKNIWKIYYEKIKEKHREIGKCNDDAWERWRNSNYSGGIVGVGKLCNGSYGKQAFPECGDIEFSRCELDRAQEKNYKLCLDKVNAKKRKNDTEYSSHEIYKQYEKGKELSENAKSLYEAIRNPEEYMKNTLQDQFHGVVIGNKKKGYSQDETFTHLYRYGYDYAKFGINQTTDPVIKDIQKHVLEKLGNTHKEILLKIDHVDVEMNRFVKELQMTNQGTTTTSSSFKPSPVASQNNLNTDHYQDCYLQKTSCLQSCGSSSSCQQNCEDQWFDCRWK